MQKKLKVMFKNLKLIKIYKKNIFVRSRTFKIVERSKTFKNVQIRSKNKVLGDHSCIFIFAVSQTFLTKNMLNFLKLESWTKLCLS